MDYALSNPAKDNLVERVVDRPGVDALSAIDTRVPLIGRKPTRFFRPDGELPESAALEFDRPPGFESWTEAARRVPEDADCRRRRASGGLASPLEGQGARSGGHLAPVMARSPAQPRAAAKGTATPGLQEHLAQNRGPRSQQDVPHAVRCMSREHACRRVRPIPPGDILVAALREGSVRSGSAPAFLNTPPVLVRNAQPPPDAEGSGPPASRQCRFAYRLLARD
jgi:hypothetical protein